MRYLAIAVVICAVLAGCDSDTEKPTMPDVVGEPLNVAKVAIESAGFSGEVEVNGGGLFGVVVEENWVVCEQAPAAGDDIETAPTLAVDRECDVEGGDEGGESAAPTASPSVTPSAEPSATAAYVYSGPDYDVVAIDEDAGSGVLDQYWVLTDDLASDSATYRDQVKAIVSDLAHKLESPDVIVQVVTDPEIIEAESAQTGGDFMNSHDADYWNDVMVPKEKKHWVAWYTGGFDYDESELSDADSAYTITWLPGGKSVDEQWKPSM
jgi:hypothetical protein